MEHIILERKYPVNNGLLAVPVSVVTNEVSLVYNAVGVMDVCESDFNSNETRAQYLKQMRIHAAGRLGELLKPESLDSCLNRLSDYRIDVDLLKKDPSMINGILGSQNIFGDIYMLTAFYEIGIQSGIKKVAVLCDQGDGPVSIEDGCAVLSSKNFSIPDFGIRYFTDVLYVGNAILHGISILPKSMIWIPTKLGEKKYHANGPFITYCDSFEPDATPSFYKRNS